MVMRINKGSFVEMICLSPRAVHNIAAFKPLKRQGLIRGYIDKIWQNIIKVGVRNCNLQEVALY